MRDTEEVPSKGCGVMLLGTDHRPTFADPTACELIGCASLPQLQRDWSRLEPLLRPLFEDPAARQSAEVEVESERGVRRLSLGVHALGQPAGSSGHLFVMQDRDHLDALDAGLLSASILRSLARLSRSLLHDLKAPLNAMLLNVELLKALDVGAGAASNTPMQRQRALGVLENAVGRLNRALEGLFARAFSHTQHTELFDLRQVITDIEALVRPQATLEHVALQVELPNHPVQLRGDRTQLGQAILNVVINALDAASGNGRVSIHVQAVEARATITVMDSGMGLPAQLLEKLGAVRFSTKHGGTGIGLYVARTVVGAHGGELAIDSPLGTGTTVRMILPHN